MEREEPTFGKVDPADLEFRPRVYRGPSRSHARNHDADGLPWKIGVAVGIAVLTALILFNLYERAQVRRDAEAIARALQLETQKMEAELRRSIPVYQRPSQDTHVAPTPVRPIPPGFRCMDGALLTRENGGWVQVTSRSPRLYCPGGSVSECYRVTPRSVGCGYG